MAKTGYPDPAALIFFQERKGRLRERNLFIPLDLDEIDNPDEKMHVAYLNKLWRSLDLKCLDFQKEHWAEIEGRAPLEAFVRS